MFIYNKERLLPVIDNIITITVNDGYLYVYRDVYDAAIILKERYRDLGGITAHIMPQRNSSAVSKFYEEAPNPINMLAPFLGMVSEDYDYDFEKSCGYIHIIGKIIDFVKYLSIDSKLRKDAVINIISDDDYIIAWAAIIKEWFTLEDALTAFQPKYVVQPQQMMYPPYPPYGQPYPTQSESKPVEEDDEEEDDDDDMVIDDSWDEEDDALFNINFSVTDTPKTVPSALPKEEVKEVKEMPASLSSILTKRRN